MFELTKARTPRNVRKFGQKKSWNLQLVGGLSRKQQENLGCYSLEALKFINDMVRYNHMDRPDI